MQLMALHEAPGPIGGKQMAKGDPAQMLRTVYETGRLDEKGPG